MQEGEENDFDHELWYACAGPMVNIPEVNSTVFYFPQGHLEHERVRPTDDFLAECYPANILCRVESVKVLVERETKEACIKIRLVPIKNKDAVELKDSGILVSEPKNSDNSDNSDSFYAKALSEGEAYYRAELEIPQSVAKKFLPPMDYPQGHSIPVKDIHGVTWGFQHIYRTMQRRHFLVTEGPSFIKETKLDEGDSLVFLKSENRDLRVGGRRRSSRRSWDETMQVVKLASSGKAFDVFYYPTPNRPEFCVKAAVVKAALEVASPGKRFKMAFENELSIEGSERISWGMGSITAFKEADPKWPDSHWKQLQVSWNEQNPAHPYPTHVNPWMVEILPDIQVSPPKKKVCVQQDDDHPIALTMDIQGAEKPDEQVSCLSATDSASQDS